MQNPAPHARLDAVDGLRGLAIALVVAYHCWLVYGAELSVRVFGWTLSLQALAKTGFLGVELFFALSGFCMFYPYAQARFRGTPSPSWATYAYRRAIKVVPSYVLALTVFAVLYAARTDVPGGIAAAYVAHLTFVHPFFPDFFQSISAPLWTIGVEVQFYLLFPLICTLMLRRPVTAVSGVVAIALAYRFWLIATGRDENFFWTSQVIAFIDVFAAGMLAAYVVAWYRNRPTVRVPERAATALSLGSAALALYGLVVLSQSQAINGTPTDFFVWQTHWRLVVAAVLFCLVTTTTLAVPQWRHVVANRAFTFLAVVSYNLYLWHLEILQLSQRAQFALPIAVFASLAVATAVTYLLEMPILRMKAPWARQPSAVAVSAPQREQQQAA